MAAQLNDDQVLVPRDRHKRLVVRRATTSAAPAPNPGFRTAPNPATERRLTSAVNETRTGMAERAEWVRAQFIEARGPVRPVPVEHDLGA